MNNNEISIAGGRLRYRLISENTEVGTSYGAEIICTLFGEEETARVYDMTYDRAAAARFVYLLADNAVLPSSLEDIAEDYIAAEYIV
ncbi:MAG: DUF6514 family protein [Oscillospiraceae bacterium]